MKNLRPITKVMLVIMLLFVCSWMVGFTVVDKATGQVKELGLKCPGPTGPVVVAPPPPPPEDPHPPKD